MPIKIPAHVLTYQGQSRREQLRIELRHGPGRANQFEVWVNGQRRQDRAGLSAVLAGLRKAIGRGGVWE